MFKILFSSSFEKPPAPAGGFSFPRERDDKIKFNI
jgi:hypothetical protein